MAIRSSILILRAQISLLKSLPVLLFYCIGGKYFIFAYPMKQPKRSGPLFLFYLLVAYVIVQCLWWSYHLVQLNNEVYTLKSVLSAHDPGQQEILKIKLDKRWKMIIGESAVFLFLLILGFIKIRKGFKTEANLAKQQNNFLLSVTHELRSPLASARLQLETINKRDLEKEKQKEIISNCLNDVDRLNNLVENLLLAANLDNRNFKVYKESLNFSDFVSETLQKYVNAFGLQQRVKINVQPGIHFTFDKTAFISIIINLLENALKYSGEKISVELKRKEEKIYLSIADEGRGIPENEKQNIFKKFYRVQNEEIRDAKGTGIGLYLVKNLTELHKGDIKVEDNFPKGSVFKIILPDEK